MRYSVLTGQNMEMSERGFRIVGGRSEITAPKQVIDRVGALAKLAIAEAGAAESEVAAMPAGGHAIQGQTRRAVERRADAILAQLQDLGGDSIAAAIDRELSESAEDAEVARSDLG